VCFWPAGAAVKAVHAMSCHNTYKFQLHRLLLRFFSQGALNITKIRNRLSKETFEIIMCLKSWGVLREDILEDKENSQAIEKIEDSMFVLHILLLF